MNGNDLLFMAAILVCGPLVGNEFAVSAFVHPQLRKLPDAAHAAAAQALARILGKFMPLWYALAAVLSCAVAYRLWPIRAISHDFALAAVALWLGAIVYTVTLPVPINNEIVGWDLTNLPADWKTRRLRWDTLHAIRVVWLTAAFLCLAFACLCAERGA